MLQIAVWVALFLRILSPQSIFFATFDEYYRQSLLFFDNVLGMSPKMSIFAP